MATQAKETREIRTYLSISHPIDPAEVFTLTDMDMSYALASTLVEWDDSKQLIAVLASRWNVEEGKLRFTLSEKAKWSNGEPVTSLDVKRSMDRAKRVHGADLKSLFDSIHGIECPDSKTVVFLLTQNASPAVVLKKLTEPMYGVVRIREHDKLDLAVTSGPYSLERDASEETVLALNSLWINREAGMADRITIRSPKPNADAQSVLFHDSWPNLVASHSLMPEPLLAQISAEHFGVWKRSFDRTLILTFYGGRLKSKDGFELFKYLRKHLDRSTVSENLTGFSLASQLFPSGSAGFSEELACEDVNNALAPSLVGKKLKILISPERISPALRDNISHAIEKVIGVAPQFREVPLNKLSAATKDGDYDFYLGSFGVADPNLEGALSFFFELSLPPIASTEGVQNFSKRTAELRAEKDDLKRLKGQKAMLRDAVCYGHIVPLFHFSSIVIARPEIDLSKVPATDESVSFSKVRFR